MPTEPLPPSRLRFHKPLPTTPATSPKRRIELGVKRNTSALPYAKPVKREQSAAEKMMRGVLAGRSAVKSQDSLYEKLKAEAGKKGADSKGLFASPGRIARNIVRDLSSAIGTIARGASNLLKGKRKEGKQPLKKMAPTKKHGVISELLRMGFVAGGTFGVAMLAMNWTAYASIVNFYYDKTTGTQVEQQQRLENLVDKPNPAPQIPAKLAVDPDAAAPTLPKAGLERPPLTLDVAPPDNRIVIPKIGKNVPIVEVPDRNLIKQDWKALEHDIQEGLLEGVVHYPGTATPGSKGNFFITGHSSFYAWTKSKYKDVFALLPEVGVGDRVTVYYDQRKYTYEIVSETTVSPSDTTPLKATADNRITIMTCVPVGTDLNRLILVGKLIPEA